MRSAIIYIYACASLTRSREVLQAISQKLNVMKSKAKVGMHTAYNSFTLASIGEPPIINTHAVPSPSVS